MSTSKSIQDVMVEAGVALAIEQLTGQIYSKGYADGYKLGKKAALETIQKALNSSGKPAPSKPAAKPAAKPANGKRLQGKAAAALRRVLRGIPAKGITPPALAKKLKLPGWKIRRYLTLGKEKSYVTCGRKRFKTYRLTTKGKTFVSRKRK